jgi:hypothetical protein
MNIANPLNRTNKDGALQRYIDRYNLVKENKDFLQNKLFLEFGVMNGDSMLDFFHSYKENKISQEFFGFDSFYGLPTEILDTHNPIHWRQGKFSTGGIINNNLIKPEITLINGWFSDTLNESTYKLFNNKKAGLVHIDCDIYSSTIECLEFLVKYDMFESGTILVYDDWASYTYIGSDNEYINGEAKAHKEIMTKYNIQCELIAKPNYTEAHIVAIFKVI